MSGREDGQDSAGGRCLTQSEAMGKKNGSGAGGSPKGVVPDPICPVTGMLLDAGFAPQTAAAPVAGVEPRTAAAPTPGGGGGGKKGGRQGGGGPPGGEGDNSDSRKNGGGKAKPRKDGGAKGQAKAAPVAIVQAHAPQVTRVNARQSGAQRESPPIGGSKGGNYAGARFQSSPDPATLPMPMLGKKTLGVPSADAPGALQSGGAPPQPSVFFANSARVAAPESTGVATDPRQSRHHVQMHGQMMAPSLGAHCHAVSAPMHGGPGADVYAQYGMPQPAQGSAEEMTAGLKSLLGF